MTTRAPYPQQPPSDRHGPGGGPAGPGSGGGPGRERPSRARRLIPLGLAGWALLEIWLLILVGQAVGGLTVLALLVAGFLIGSAVIKRAGRRAWRRLAETVQQAQQAQNGGSGAQERDKNEGERGSRGNALGMLGGLLLMVPGLLSDVAGLLCLFPPSAALLRRGTQRYLGRSAGAGSLGDAYRQAREAEEQLRIHRPDGKVVEGEVIEGEVVRDDVPPEARPPGSRGPSDR